MDEHVDCNENKKGVAVETAPKFLENLQNSVKNNQNKVFATWYNSNAKPTDQYTFQQIWDEASVIAHDLRLLHKLHKGDRVILCYNFGLQFFPAFLGCLRAGIVAIPVYPPSPQNLPKALVKLTKIIQDSNAKLVLLDNAVNLIRLNPLSKSRNLWPQNVKYQVHPKHAKTSPLTNDLLQILIEMEQKDSINSNDVAFLQYTSGSTGDPKGVMVTFKALNANVLAIFDEGIRCYKTSGASTENIVGFSWLPQYHDLGLVGAFITPFFAGWSCNMISPLDFIRNPLLWIELISSLKVNWSVAPNFAYRLAARKFMEAKNKSQHNDEPIPNLNLSSIVYLLLAAEPIQVDTKDVFQDAFGSYGLHDNWFLSCYGMAESVVCISSLFEYKLSTFQPNQGQPSVAVGHRHFFPKGLVAKVVCPNAYKELGDQQVGELWLSGPSITAGYFGKPQLTEEVFQAKITNQDSDDDKVYLRTGDLAFFENNYLYICGRQKDVIIVNGVNYYPQDIENIVQNASDAIRPGCVAAFPSNDTGAGGDLEVVFEMRRVFIFDAADIVNTVRKNIISEIGIVPTRVVAIEERTILKTTSGKIQRKANRKALHDGNHKIIFEYGDPNKIYESSRFNLMSSELMINYDPFDKIMVSFFGMGYDGTNTWDELGLSSMASVALRDKVSESFAITLDPECFETHRTPNSLKVFVLSHQGGALDVYLPLLRALKHNNLSWMFLGLLQGFCSVILLVIFTVSIVPAWYMGKFLSNAEEYKNVQIFGLSNETRWIWIPFAVPVCMFSLSICVIVLKWIVVWKYEEGIVPIPSILYLRWWFVDRAVALWEFWVGKYIINTPWINFFYSLMGAKIHRTVSIQAFIREFDLVEIDRDSSLEFQIHCRKFDKWSKHNKPSLRFRPVFIGRSCTVKGMVSAGATIGDNAIVDKLSVVQQGAKVPQGTHVIGNPAYMIKESAGIKTRSYSLGLLGLLKITWLILELYIFYGTTALGHVLWEVHLPQNWRYTSLFKWPLLVLWINFFSIFTSMLLKWTFIGKRRPGSQVKNTLWRTFADWAADWHFEVGVSLLQTMTNNFRFWNLVLKMHGMDLDMASKVAFRIFLPSKVDLIKIKNSFVSHSSFSPKSSNGQYYHGINIKNSTIGFVGHVDPDKTDLTISGSIVPPLSHVTSSIVADKPDPRTRKIGTYEIIWQETVMVLGYIVSYGTLFATLIPPFELCIYIFGKTSKSWIRVPVVVFALVLQNLLWTLLLKCFQYLTLMNSKEKGKPLNDALHIVYIDVAFFYQCYSFLYYTLLGSPAFNFIVRLLGVQFEGRALLFPHRIYEFPFITIADRTILDGAHVTGHYVVYDNFKVGPCRVAGVMHEGSYAANTVITSKECECLRAFIGTYEVPKQGKLRSGGDNDDDSDDDDDDDNDEV